MKNPFELIDARLSNIESLILDIKHKPKPDEQIDRWLDLSEFCDYHPDKPKKQTVYAWVSAGKVPFHKGQKKLRFLRSEVDDWLKKGGRNV
ncbi:MAG: excisionase family DNA binding protein [Candidatus Latescibacterota bacterium]|jgi:excisionase family DNA binding protein